MAILRGGSEEIGLRFIKRGLEEDVGIAVYISTSAVWRRSFRKSNIYTPLDTIHEKLSNFFVYKSLIGHGFVLLLQCFNFGILSGLGI
jgi:hypothetical protein